MCLFCFVFITSLANLNIVNIIFFKLDPLLATKYFTVIVNFA